MWTQSNTFQWSEYKATESLTTQPADSTKDCPALVFRFQTWENAFFVNTLKNKLISPYIKRIIYYFYILDEKQSKEVWSSLNFNSTLWYWRCKISYFHKSYEPTNIRVKNFQIPWSSIKLHRKGEEWRHSEAYRARQIVEIITALHWGARKIKYNFADRQSSTLPLLNVQSCFTRGNAKCHQRLYLSEGNDAASHIRAR